MRLFIHDLSNDQFEQSFTPAPDDWVVQAEPSAAHCIGCFNCWVKHPGHCIYEDDFTKVPILLGHADEIVVIAELWYGSYSPSVKAIFDRSIGFTQPFFTKRDGEMHHVMRYANDPSLTVYFYGDTENEQERELAREHVLRNTINFKIARHAVHFLPDPSSLKEAQ